MSTGIHAKLHCTRGRATRVSPAPTRVVILGAGFGSLYAALELERTVAADPDAKHLTLRDIERANHRLASTRERLSFPGGHPESLSLPGDRRTEQSVDTQ